MTSHNWHALGACQRCDSARMTESKFTDPTAPSHVEVWRIDTPTYTAEVDGTTITFELWASGTPRHYGTIGTYARGEHPTRTIVLPDGSTAPEPIYRAAGNPVGWTDTYPVLGDLALDQSTVKRGRNRRGATAEVTRQGRASRGEVVESDDGTRSVVQRSERDLVDAARAWTLSDGCADCVAACAECESVDAHDDRGWCPDCVDGCGCLPSLSGIEGRQWANVVAGGLATDTRRQTLDDRWSRNDARLADRIAATDRIVSDPTKTAGAKDRARDTVKRAKVRHAATRERITADRATLWTESFGWSATCPVAVAHDSLSGVLSAAIGTLDRDDLAALREHFASRGIRSDDIESDDTAGMIGTQSRRVTRWPDRNRIGSVVWRKSESPVVESVGTVIYDDGRSWRGHRVRDDGTVIESTATVTPDARVIALPAVGLDPDHAWIGHRYGTRPEPRTARTGRTIGRPAGTSNETCPIAPGETTRLLTTGRITRHDTASYTVKKIDGTRIRTRTYTAAQRHATT